MSEALGAWLELALMVLQGLSQPLSFAVTSQNCSAHKPFYSSGCHVAKYNNPSHVFEGRRGLVLDNTISGLVQAFLHLSCCFEEQYIPVLSEVYEEIPMFLFQQPQSRDKRK